MKLQTRAPACAFLLVWLAGIVSAQELTEAQIIEQFMNASPYAREAKAAVDVVRAEAEGRTLLPNPAAVASREGAGYAAFYQLEQQLPISGRRGVLKRVGSAAISAEQAAADGALWRLRADVRAAFYRLLGAQMRQNIFSSGTQELEDVIKILRTREAEGEGSRYDRLRAERELAEYRSQLAATRAEVAQARASLLAFLPEGSNVDRVTGSLQTLVPLPSLDGLLSRAFSHRSEIVFERRQAERFQLEARAAERLRVPEPIAVVGIKRGDIAPGITQTSSAVGVTIPLPLFNKGQTEVARFTAEQARSVSRREGLERRVRAEVLGALEALRLRQDAIEQYRREVEQAGSDLSRITKVAYEEGELGILELLDSYRINRQAALRALELQTLAKEAAIELDRAVGEEVKP